MESPSQLKFKCKVQGGEKPFDVEVSSAATGKDLILRISQELQVAPGSLKVIASGKRVSEDIPATTVGKVLLVMRNQNALPESAEKKAKLEAQEIEQAKLAKLREAALQFASKSNSNHGMQYFAEIQDQNGKVVQLPEKDRQNLIAGQVLHEQGKKMLEKGQFEEAMHVLLDAERMFNSVSAALIAIIDNYGLLMLDICWCFLKIGKVESLRDATSKLRAARDGLERAHGKNLERLNEVKGVVSPEQTVYCRLYLLQGVVAFHRGEEISSLSYFRQAEDLINALRVTDEEIASLLVMGFTEKEARRGMRVANKDPEQAVVAIMSRRDELQEQSRQRRRQRKQEKIGKTAGGDYVDLELLDQLVAMGFEERISGQALRQTNNDQAAAVELLTNNPEILRERPPEVAPPAFNFAPETVETLCAMGFSREQAEAALAQCQGDGEAAAGLLLSGEVPLEPLAEPPLEGDNNNNNADFLADVPQQEETPEQRKKREEEEREQEIKFAAERDLIDTLADNAEHDPDAAFDLLLDEEMTVLKTYFNLLGVK